MRMPDEIRQDLLYADEGSEWIYWDVEARLWRRVVLLAVPSDDPKRVRIQHLDTEMRGAAEWVPAGRLHVPWALGDEYLASMGSVGRLESHAPKAFVVDIATLLLSDYIDQSVADLFRNGASGVLEVRDLEALTALLGRPDGSDYLTHPDAVLDGNRAFLPWPACERILVSLIAKDPLPAVRLLDERTRRQQKFDSLVDREGERWWMRSDATGSEARRLRQWHEDGLRAIATLERWLDAETPSLALSYIELRGMYDDLATAARQAIPRIRMVRAHISERLADRLQEMVDRPTPLLDIQGLRRIRVEGEDETEP